MTATNCLIDGKQSWLLASANRDKLIELQALLEPFNKTIVAQSTLGIADAIEDGQTFVENALIKARHASHQAYVLTGQHLPALADDSGLCVPVLDNAPGIYSARFAQMHGFALESVDDKDKLNNFYLWQLLQDRKIERTEAFFVSVLVFVRYANDPLPLIAQGLWQGEIIAPNGGDGGFGYDPLFFSKTLQKRASELNVDEKNNHSHRGQALIELKRQLARFNLL